MKANQLKELVPSVELCKKIPNSSFVCSALRWVYFGSGWHNTMEWGVFERDGDADGYPSYSAPTLREIMDQLTRMDLCPELRAIITAKGKFIYTLQTGLETFCQQQDESVEDMVLRSWLYFQKEREETSIANNSEVIEYKGKKYCRVFETSSSVVDCAAKCCFAVGDECGAPEPFTGCAVEPLSHWEEVKEQKDEKEDKDAEKGKQ